MSKVEHDVSTAYMEFEGQEMAYSVYGSGPRVVVLTHGILLNKEMFKPLATNLAERGNRVVTIDMVGHGESDADPRKVSIPFYGRAVRAVMDELEIKEAVIGGTSLGANVTLEVALAEPERLRGMVVEMPALENAMLGGAAFFVPLLAVTKFAAPVAAIGSRLMRFVPRGIAPYGVEILLDVLRRDPRSTYGVIQGVFFDRLAPGSRDRRTINVPALVLGHRYDPVHPFSDAERLADELPDARFVEARDILELRLTPKRLTDEIAKFVDECWRPRAVKTAPGDGPGGNQRKRKAR